MGTRLIPSLGWTRPWPPSTPWTGSSGPDCWAPTFQSEGLTALADAVAGSPLAAVVTEATEKAAADGDPVGALAVAHTALLGSAHDAFTARLGEATGRALGEVSAVEPSEGQAVNLLAAARSWLDDLARAGWRGIDHDVVSGAAQIVSAMPPDPALRRLATLLDGFAAELAASGPGDHCAGPPLDRLPARIAVPVFLEGYEVHTDDEPLTFTVAGHALAVDTGRVPVVGTPGRPE
ncbi:hypothetical protein [Streptoalloteichus hindustanus]|nr:hypothetical protein [Streptoalloteichus hindustanus]